MINKSRLNIILSFLVIIVWGFMMWFFLKDSYIQYTGNLPDSFTIKMKGDYTSSAAGREYESSLTFVDNKLVSGSQSYLWTIGAGCKINCRRKYECIVSDQKWVDAVNNGQCDISSYTPLTKIEIEQQIKNKELKPMKECWHGDTCYEIVK